MFLLLALAAFAGAWMLEHVLLPQLAARHPLNADTPVFRQTQALMLLRMRYLAILAGAMVPAVWFLRLDSLNWKRAGVAVILLGAALRLATPDLALNSVPFPDGVHYQLLAMTLVQDQSLSIQAGTFAVPSRMPPGPSFVMALTQWIQPAHFGQGIYAIWATAVLGLLFTYWIGRRLWGVETGILAAALVALSPLHGYFSRQLMGEMPWALIVLIALYLVACGSRSSARLLAGGLVLGLGMLFKPVHVGIIAAFGLGLLWEWARFRDRPRLAALIAFSIGIVLGSLPLFLYQKFVLGDWLTTGYHVYDLAGASLRKLFSYHYLFGPPIRRGDGGNLLAYGISALGVDPRPERTFWYFPFSLLLLLLPFSWKLGWRNGEEPQRLAWRIAMLATLLYAVPFLFYGYQQPRFFLPILPLWALVMAKPAADLVVRANAARPLALLLMLALCVMTATGAAILRVETDASRIPERLQLQRVSALAPAFDAIATDEDPLLMAHFGAWRRGTDLIPLRMPDQPWYTDDPPETLRTQRTVCRPYEGAVPQIARRLQAGQRVALWLRYPQRNPSIAADLRREFVIVEHPEAAVSDWADLVVR